MKRYLLKRVTTGLLTVLIAIVLNFFLIHIAPRDPIRIMAGMDHSSSEQLEALYVRYGLDKPLLVQLGQYIVNLLQGDFGISLAYVVAGAALISGVLGMLIGGAAGFIGGRTDRVISELINIFLMLPTFFLVLITVALFGSSITNVMIIIGLTSWPGNARLMRVQAMSLKERVFVKSAEALGESKASILFRYIIPNGIYPVVANTAMGIASAILMEASLSFPGLGDPNIIS